MKFYFFPLHLKPKLAQDFQSLFYLSGVCPPTSPPSPDSLGDRYIYHLCDMCVYVFYRFMIPGGGQGEFLAYRGQERHRELGTSFDVKY